MDKKTLPLVIVLILLIVFFNQILGFLGLVPPPAEQPAQTADTTSEVVQYQEPAAPVGEQAVEQATIADDTSLAETVALTAPDTVVVITEKYRVIMSTHGGGPLSMILNEYTHRDGTPVEMLAEAEAATPDARFAGHSFASSSLGYECNLRSGEYSVNRDPLEVVYTSTAAHGGSIVKRYIFYPDSYHYDLVLTVNGNQHYGFERKYSLVWNTSLTPTEPQLQADYEAMQAVAMTVSDSRESLDDFNDGVLNQTLDGDTRWAGVREKYFAAMIIPRTKIASAVFANGVEDNQITADGTVQRRRVTFGLVIPLASEATVSDSFTVFVGPLDYTLLSEYQIGLEDMLDIGTTPFIGWLIKPFALGIIWLLPRMYDVIPNYGLVIILFALLVKVVTLPLSLKSFKSMQAMRDLGPQLEVLKQKHKKDPQALNRETMKMYKKAGVNPMSGCLPILPQMPLFFALFSVFKSTILLRDAPFVWFITDLSRGASGFMDPYIILVVIMIGAQFLSQKITMPSTGQNKALGYMMPLFMGFIFYKFASGLVLYWICFSLFSLLDYIVFRKGKNAEVKSA
ncbi:MAG: membrane protein insertase YidC [bacterium]